MSCSAAPFWARGAVRWRCCCFSCWWQWACRFWRADAGGLGLFVSPTAGFLIGFPLAAFAAGWITERWRSVPLGIASGVAAAVGGILVLYAFGVTGMAIVLDKSWGEAALLITAFLPGDAIKAVLAGLITAALARARPRAVLSRL